MTENIKDYETTNNTESDERGPHLGFRMFPGRVQNKEYSLWENIWNYSYDSSYNKIICERNVHEAFKRHPILKILKGALKNAGCPLDLKRHVVCEDCTEEIQGGYDYEYNQIVVCKNKTKVRNHPETILIHELIHMYDACVNDINFKDLNHLACTEIRAANIAHCSFLSSVILGSSSPINIKKTHEDCVKTLATKSIKLARNLDFPTTVKHVLKVFDKCYNDLEPVGRRIRRNSEDCAMAEEEAKCFLIT